jgi:hypothetical protein
LILVVVEKVVTQVVVTATRFSPRAGIRGFDTHLPGPGPLDLRLDGPVSVPERGFVALIPVVVGSKPVANYALAFQSPSGDSWL